MNKKFRVWTGEKMIYCCDKRNDTSLIFHEHGWELIDHFTGEIIPLIQSWKNDKGVLMQSIEIIDIYNKDIYEYDLILFKNKKTNIEKIGYVIFDKGMYIIKSEFTSDHHWENYECKIIGNKFEFKE